ncbi:P-loop containing nucleoside triphosphate hydrolase protein [Scleroderma citrinum]
MDPPSEATHEPVRATGSTSTPSVRRRVDHTASSYYPEIISILKGTFKLSHFRKNQLECITATLDGKDVFYLAPTGGGKSLCYQLPALCSTGKTQGTTFVISPLLSLIEDQVSTLRKKGINAFRLINTVDADQANDAMPRLRKGESLPLVYTTPEKLLGSNNVQDIVVQLYNQKQLARFVVDEAHVIGGWRVWRESYASLGILRKQWPDIPIMALTGSANMSAIEDIKESLALRNPVCLKQSFNRSNLYYKVKKKPSQKKELLKEIAGFIQSHHKDDTGIIYCLSRDDCEDVARRLREEFNLSARHFHAGMDRDSKRINQEDWSNGKCKIIVATIAFGMGIDKPDVRFVIHATMSKDMDGYYQETGRAGRDGEPSDCVLFYAYSDAMKIQNMLKNPHDQNNKPPPDEIQRQLERLSAVVAYASNEGDCRRVAILRHFDEEFDEAECHKSCDNCCKPGTVVNEDHTETAQQAVQLLRDMSNCSRERGIALTMFKDVWRGKKGATVSAYTGLPGYAAASKLDHRMIDRIVTQLLYSNIFTTRRTTSGNGFGNNYLEVCNFSLLSRLSD